MPNKNTPKKARQVNRSSSFNRNIDNRITSRTATKKQKKTIKLKESNWQKTRLKFSRIGKKNPKNKKSKVKKLLRIAIIIAIIGFIAALAIFLWYAKDLPSPDKINSKFNSEQTTKLYDRTGNTLLYEIYGDKNRTIVGFDKMSKHIKDATVAIEDKDFYKHGAFSPQGIVRAFYFTLVKRNTQGGSTITQQLVKNALLTNERTVPRKIKELILAIEIEQIYKKDDILKIYLNEIPYGSTTYGVQAAAKSYFDKDAIDLDIAESAMLASLPQRPTYYSPYFGNTEALVARQKLVLSKMLDQKYISQQEYDEAIKVDILAKIKPRRAYVDAKAPHFVEYVRSQLEQKYGIKKVNEGGLKVITSLDIGKQELAERTINEQMTNVRNLGGSNVGLVASNPQTGEILAMVGSHDYSEPNYGNVNVTTSLRQPGSSIKPIVYSSLFKGNWGPGSTVYDVPTDFGYNNYKPHNYTRKNYGAISFRQAIGSSLNIPAVKAIMIGGIPETLQTATDMGITTIGNFQNYGPSFALGASEVKLTDMIQAYSVLAMGGNKIDQRSILKITQVDPRGKESVLEDFKADKIKSTPVLDPQIAFLVTDMMSDNNARTSLGLWGVNNPMYLGNRPAAVKTGTTEYFNDAWAIGFTPSFVTGIWVGNNDNAPMLSSSGAIAAPIWNKYMREALSGQPIEQFSRPAGIQEITIDGFTGKAVTPATKQQRKDLFPSWYKVIPAKDGKKAVIDKVSKKLATDCTPVDAREEVSSSYIQAEIDPGNPNFNNWNAPVQALAGSLGSTIGAIPTENDDVHSCSDALPGISISSTGGGPTYTIVMNISAGTHPLKEAIILADNNPALRIDITSPGTYNTTYTFNTPGAHYLSAKIVDQALYSSGSNTINVSSANAPAGSINCAGNTCSVSASNVAPYTIAQVELFYNGVSQGVDNTMPYSWGGFNNNLTGNVTATITNSAGVSTNLSF